MHDSSTSRRVAAGSEDKLNSHAVPVTDPGWPEPDRYPVRECLLCILNEEWNHRLYAERDLAVLESRGQEQHDTGG